MLWTLLGPIAFTKVVSPQRAALGENLKDMPVSFFHGIEHVVDEFPWDVFMEKVAHRIDEDHSGALPRKWLGQPLVTQRKVESDFERVSGSPTESLGEPLGVTIVTATAYFGAARDRVPS